MTDAHLLEPAVHTQQPTRVDKRRHVGAAAGGGGVGGEHGGGAPRATPRGG